MTVHEIKDKIIKRHNGFILSRSRSPIGVVLSYPYYRMLCQAGSKPWEQSMVLSEHKAVETGASIPGDSFMGLDVAITKAEDTIIVY